MVFKCAIRVDRDNTDGSDLVPDVNGHEKLTVNIKLMVITHLTVCNLQEKTKASEGECKNTRSINKLTKDYIESNVDNEIRGRS